jgi:hypothetical protein
MLLFEEDSTRPEDKKCDIRESNPGHTDGNGVFYH